MKCLQFRAMCRQHFHRAFTLHGFQRIKARPRTIDAEGLQLFLCEAENGYALIFAMQTLPEHSIQVQASSSKTLFVDSRGCDEPELL